MITIKKPAEFQKMAIAGATVVSASTWLILVVTTLSLIASATPVRRLPGAHPIAMAIIYVYVARIGATMDLSTASLETMGAFVLMAYVWIAVHGLFILAGGTIAAILATVYWIRPKERRNSWAAVRPCSATAAQPSASATPPCRCSQSNSAGRCQPAWSMTASMTPSKSRPIAAAPPPPVAHPMTSTPTSAAVTTAVVAAFTDMSGVNRTVSRYPNRYGVNQFRV